MSEAKGQQEPSMEEILASIRRIIAEDGEGAPAPAPRPVAEQPPAAAPQEDILDLTESVAEDGSVVSLTPGMRRAPTIEPASPAPEIAEPPPVFAPADEQQAADDELVIEEQPAEELPPAEDELEPDPEPIPLRLRSAATVARRVDPSEVAQPAEPPEAPPPPMPPPEAKAPPAPEPPPPRPAQAAPPPPPDEPRPMVGDRLVSSATAAASVAALSQLADLGQRGQVGTVPLGDSGRTLESLVRELLKPMLRDWLDAHLSPLVERLVREEIQRMARDAQGR